MTVQRLQNVADTIALGVRDEYCLIPKKRRILQDNTPPKKLGRAFEAQFQVRFNMVQLLSKIGKLFSW